MGSYNAEHRDRSRLITHLQERGFSLAAIKETLDHWTEGRSLAHLLGVSQVAPSLERKPLRLSPKSSSNPSPAWTSPRKTSSGPSRSAWSTWTGWSW